MIGSSPALLAALEQARQAARSGADILLEAESGTGKELLARLIHEESPRAGQALRGHQLCRGAREPAGEPNCSATCAGRLPARWRTILGKFALASGGTLLLDEIGEMPAGAPAQAAAGAAGAGVLSPGRQPCHLRWTCGSSPAPTVRCKAWSATGASAKTSITG